MKHTLSFAIFPLLLVTAGSAVQAQQVFRCPGVGGGPPEYINNARDAQARNCKVVSGGNVTVVQGTVVPKAAPPAARPANASSPGAPSSPRNYQRYLDRVSEMKDNIARTQSDIAGIKREMARLPAAN